MIYLVTKQQELFQNSIDQMMTVEESLATIDTFNVIQFDLETGGRDPHITNILCAQFGNKHLDLQIVVDCNTVDIKLYKTPLETKYLIGQNLKFDLQFLYNHNIIPLKVYDTMIVEQMLHLGYPPVGKPGGISYSLSAIAKRYLGIDIDKSIRGEIIWRGLDSSVLVYAANDVKWLEDIMYAQMLKCQEKQCTKGAKLECDFVPVIAYLEWCGIRLDVNKWKNKMVSNQNMLSIKEAALNKLAISWNNPQFYSIKSQGDLFEGFDLEHKCNVNWSSSQQVIKVAKYLGFDTNIKDKKTGEEKDSVVEKHLKGQKGINDEFLKVYFDYQEASKVCSTYGQTYIDAINPNTGRIHTVFKQLGASSGRMACGDGINNNTDLARFKKIVPKRCKYVQLQNLPSDEETRAAFVPNPGNTMCSCDYSSLEARLGADIYNEESMLKEYLEGSGDMHSLCAKMVFHEELKDVDVKDVKDVRPDLRKRSKGIGFSQQFGGSEFAIASSLGCSIEEALKFKNAYAAGFKGISKFKEEGSKFVRSNGYVLICEHTGHKVYWYDWVEWKDRQKSFTSEFWDRYKVIKSTNPNDPLVKEMSMHFKAASKWDRLSLNSPTQGSGIIILKDAMTQFFYWIINNNLFGKVLICNLVHDEAVIEYPSELVGTYKVLQYYMETSADKYCKKLPIPAEPAVGDHWIH